MRTIVIGSGIVGASAAYHLSMAGVEVVVADDVRPGRATDAGAGIVCPWATSLDDGPFYDLYADGAAYYGELVAGLTELGRTDIGHRRVGALVLSEDDDELAAIERRIDGRAIGRPEVGAVARIDGAEAKAMFPPLRAGIGAVHIEGGARVDGRLLAAALIDAASSGAAGAVAVHRERAELVVTDGRVRGARLAGAVIEADAVVVAAGAWTPDVTEPHGVTVDVAPQKGQIVHLGLDGVDTAAWPVLLPVGPYYLLTFDDSRVVVGATREIGSGFDVRVTAGGLAEVLEAGLAIAPGLADARIIETRVGLRPAATALPTIGAVPGVDGLFVGTGLGAAGLTTGPLTGRMLADLALGRPVGRDLSPFAPAGLG